ncbi:5836_t:CDS:10 [Dentiscutata erythropus]|uniref:5836_t:CDS:1 n=1 Tax=Dentiscutata erythropus TaxID=1348616 RepID=A0A9N9ADD1_9GLOM|nr:5836_t:CDS:10 [Dentiscutata erythropus]
MVFNRYGRFVFSERESIITLAQKCGAQVIFKEEILEGYQLYIVEQWACDRRPYNTVTVFTGEPTHKIKVCVILIEEERFQPYPEKYPEKLEILFSDLEEDKTRLKDTTLGTIFVTNLSSFPSSLSTILVTEGDYNVYYPQFRLNLNLRRISCSGKTALSLKPPTELQKQKFFQLYSVPEKIPLEFAVIQLVKYVQTTLYLIFGFPQHFVDGLLCNFTESCLREFKNEHASNFENLDNIFDPNLVAMIFKMVLSIRNKLHYLNYQVGKDPFIDTETFINGVISFQKSTKRDSISHKLDSEIVNKINETYNRSRYPDGLKMRKRSKSFTNAELARKQGACSLYSRTFEIDIQTYMVYKNLKGREATLEDLIKNLKSTAKKYDDQIEQLSNAYEERYQKFKSTEEFSLKILSKQKKVTESVKQIYSDATARGKLNYELILLEDKLKEIDEFIEQFCFKVQVMESKLPHSSRSVKALFNVWNYLQDQWNTITSRLYNRKSDEDKE